MPRVLARRVLAHLRSPPVRVRGRRPTGRVFAACAAERRTARESRRRSAVILEDKDPAHAAIGFCRMCSVTHRLERDASAEREARKLMDTIRHTGRLDFDSPTADPRFALDKMYQPGGGKMLGVLIATRVCHDKNLTVSDLTQVKAPCTSTPGGQTKEPVENESEIVILKAFSGQLYGEWRVPGWAPPLCGLTHDSGRYVETRKVIEAKTCEARGLKTTASSMETALHLEKQKWDLEIQKVSNEVKKARTSRREERRDAAVSRRDDDDGEKNGSDEHRLAEESRAGKRRVARVREEKATAMGPSVTALETAKQGVQKLREEHRNLSAALLAEIFESYRLPNFRQDFGFGVLKGSFESESSDADGAGVSSTSETRTHHLRVPYEAGASLSEYFVENEPVLAQASEEKAKNPWKNPASDTNTNVSTNSTKPTALPCGCGDCCAPKLLAECALRGLKPLAIAETWMGSPTRKQGDRNEGEFYGACRGRCRPILGHMLCGADELRGAGPIRV